MIPGRFVILSRLPRNRSGKIDRGALPEPAPLEPKNFTPPRDENERQIAAIWAEVLDLERVSIEEDFFALGGHSLNATGILARVNKLCGTNLPLAVLFNGPTVAQLASAVVEAETALRQTHSKPQALDEDALLAGIDELSEDEAALLLDQLQTQEGLR